MRKDAEIEGEGEGRPQGKEEGIDLRFSCLGGKGNGRCAWKTFKGFVKDNEKQGSQGKGVQRTGRGWQRRRKEKKAQKAEIL